MGSFMAYSKGSTLYYIQWFPGLIPGGFFGFSYYFPLIFKEKYLVVNTTVRCTWVVSLGYFNGIYFNKSFN